ncbi:response regulator [Paraburkholderia sp. 2C]
MLDFVSSSLSEAFAHMKTFPHTARWTLRTLLRQQANQRRRLLVIDNDKNGAEAITASLCLLGYDTQFATGAQAAFHAIAVRMPEIALLDINMPDIDGFALAQQLRREGRTQHIVLVAFTAYDEITVHANGIAAGFDGYCRKSTAPDSLLRLLGQMAA